MFVVYCVFFVFVLLFVVFRVYRFKFYLFLFILLLSLSKSFSNVETFAIELPESNSVAPWKYKGWTTNSQCRGKTKDNLH